MKIKSTLLLSLLALVVVCITPATFYNSSLARNANSFEDPTAADVLAKMAAVYAECRTYRDKGVVQTTFLGANGKRTTERPFTTAFVRPDRFRFEYREQTEQSRYIVWARGKDVRTWWTIEPGVSRERSLDMALAGATGVSGGSAHTIPALLLPGRITGFKLTEISGAARESDERWGEVDCYRIAGQWAGERTVLWIEKATFMIRKIDSQHTFTNFRTEQITTYEPVINQDVEEPLLEFGAPSQ